MGKGKKSRSKWKKHRILKHEPALSSHVPSTCKFSMEHLRSMLKETRSVMVKPTKGSGGEGVMKVQKMNSGGYHIQKENRVKKFSDLKEVYRYVVKQKKGSLIVQRYIRLARIDGRPFDFRVMIQRKSRKSKWKVTGSLAKVAGKGYVITNVRRSHGKVKSADAAIRDSDIRKKSKKAIMKNIKRISKLCAKTLARYYRSIRTVGMDIGLDRNGKVWIIEANFTPNLSLFKKLKDKSAYKKIVSYQKG